MIYWGRGRKGEGSYGVWERDQGERVGRGEIYIGGGGRRERADEGGDEGEEGEGRDILGRDQGERVGRGYIYWGRGQRSGRGGERVEG